MEDNPAVIYLIEGRLPRNVPDLTDLTSRYLLGIRLNCAQCHDHPFVKWKQQGIQQIPAFEDSREKIGELLTDQRIDQAIDKWLADTRKQVAVRDHDEKLP